MMPNDETGDAMTPVKVESAAIEKVLIGGDLSPLNEGQRSAYYLKVCESVGLNPLTKPFEYLKLNGKLILYATRACTDQLRNAHGVSIEKLERETVEGVYCVTAHARDANGRTDSSLGAVTIKGLQGDALANAMMKAETKSKRRVTLSICGLGMLDETELETIPATAKQPADPPALPPKQANGTPQTFAADFLKRVIDVENQLMRDGKCNDSELRYAIEEQISKAGLPDDLKEWDATQRKLGGEIAKRVIAEFQARDGQDELGEHLAGEEVAV